jgi:hypothetical protein
MIREANKRITDIEKKLNDLQFQIDCFTQMLGYVRTENDFVNIKYKGDVDEYAYDGDKDPYP